MEAWRVTVVDGRLKRFAGFAVVLAADAETAGDAVVEYLKNDSSYEVPFSVSAVEPHNVERAEVLVFNWGEWDDYPPAHDTPSPAD